MSLGICNTLLFAKTTGFGTIVGELRHIILLIHICLPLILIERKMLDTLDYELYTLDSVGTVIRKCTTGIHFGQIIVSFGLCTQYTL
jgi:hypothetical protein